MLTGLLFLAMVVVALMAYVRLSPLDTARWHRPVEATSDEEHAGGAVRIVAGDEALFRQIAAAALRLPRTTVLAGSVEAGHVTYVTRSVFFGFPDLTTIERRDGEVRMHARLRFGVSDLGVNAKRLEGLIAAVEGG
ncbi:DUF1499 domain-containing protein [Roseobacter sp. YSTF-M11]|uniref:DUF1499 domain-containing protein n=1 Tax=Roseobacter insulae TaxID=2859783 RepID=A0A9X1FUV8_9RHOB|nr:DUF1499 domain-containing protein [Roseobacter insulae]MBW4708082.1 DUF1499 domain-containing protein [Roseobacter insulae]